MRTIKEEIEIGKIFEEMVFEAVFERHMNMVINQFKKYSSDPNKDIKTLFKKLGFAVDKVDASRIKVFYNIDREAEREIENALDDKTKAIFCLIRNPEDSQVHVAGVYVPKFKDVRGETEWIYFPTKEGVALGFWECTRNNPLHNYTEKSKKNRIKTFKHCCEVWIVDMGDALSIAELQRQRKNAQYGVWQNTPEFYAQVAKKNIERYKQLAAKIRMEKGSDFDLMMKQADEMVKKLYEVMMDMHANMGEGEWGRNEHLSYLASNFNDYVTRMLQRIQYVLSRQKDYEKEKSQYEKYKKGHPEIDSDDIYGIGYYLKSYREAIKDVNDYREESQKYYDSLKEGIKNFKEGKPLR